MSQRIPVLYNDIMQFSSDLSWEQMKLTIQIALIYITPNNRYLAFS